MATFKTFRVSEKGMTEIVLETGTQIMWSNYPVFLGNNNVKDTITDRILITDKLQFTTERPTSFFAYSAHAFGAEIYLITI